MIDNSSGWLCSQERICIESVQGRRNGSVFETGPPSVLGLRVRKRKPRARHLLCAPRRPNVNQCHVLIMAICKPAQRSAHPSAQISMVSLQGTAKAQHRRFPACERAESWGSWANDELGDARTAALAPNNVTARFWMNNVVLRCSSSCAPLLLDACVSASQWPSTVSTPHHPPIVAPPLLPFRGAPCCNAVQFLHWAWTRQRC